MKTSFGKLVAVSLTAVVLTSFVMVPVAEAQRRGGGGGGADRAQGGGGGADRAQGGGGGADRAQAGGGGGARQGAQVNNSKADVRSNDVRNSSVNNVNVNANRNVNVQGNSGCCNNNGWDNPLAAAAVVGGTIAAVGSMVARPPSNCVPVNYGGMVYQQCGATWYAPQGSQYIVVNPPY